MHSEDGARRVACTSSPREPPRPVSAHTSCLIQCARLGQAFWSRYLKVHVDSCRVLSCGPGLVHLTGPPAVTPSETQAQNQSRELTLGLVWGLGLCLASRTHRWFFPMCRVPSCAAHVRSHTGQRRFPTGVTGDKVTQGAHPRGVLSPLCTPQLRGARSRVGGGIAWPNQSPTMGRLGLCRASQYNLKRL